MDRTDSRFRVRGRNAAMLGISALVVMTVVGLSYREWRQYNRSSVEAAQIRAIVDSTGQVLTDLLDAETGQRGYLLTGENRYLEPYEDAVRAVPNDLANLREHIAARPGESYAMARFDDLVTEKLAELRQTIELRRTQGAQAALAVVLSDRGKQIMDEIRAVCSEIRRRENTSQTRASVAGEAAAGSALLIIVAGSLLLLFLFAFGVEPFASPDPQAQRRSWPLRYGAAVLAVVLMVVFRMALTPLMGARSMPFTLFFPAVWFAAWFGGLRPGALSVVLSALAGAWFFAEPTRSLLIRYHDDQVALLMLVIVGFGMALLSRSQQQGVERAIRAEETERQERQRYRELFDYTRAVMNNMGEGLYTVDTEGLVTFVNPAAAQMFGFTSAELLGKKMHDITHYKHPDGSPFPSSECAGLRVLQDGIPLRAHEDVFIRKDGSFFPVVYSASPFITGGKTVGIVVAFRDDTERRETEAVLRTANQALLRANEDLNQFAYAASHDLQEPLRMITSYSQLLVKGYRGQLEDEAAGCIEFITQGTKRMRDLLADLLAYTRLAGDEPQLPASVDLNQAMQIALENCRAAIEETAAIVTSDTLPIVVGNMPHFVQLFQNLISNSLKYRSERPPRIHVSSERQNFLWRLAVEDNGIGIAPEYHRHIFGMFKRLHTRTIPGTGIGLAICQRIVNRYGGQIWVESQAGQGAKFCFTLPAAAGAAAHDA